MRFIHLDDVSLERSTSVPILTSMNAINQSHQCRFCRYRDLHAQVGFICKLTNAPAPPEHACGRFQKAFIDHMMIPRHRIVPRVPPRIASSETPSINSGLFIGIGIAFASVVWMVVGVVLLNRLYFLSVLLLLFGAFLWLRCVLKQASENRHATGDGNALDMHL